MNMNILVERLEQRPVVIVNEYSSNSGEVQEQLGKLGVRPLVVPTHKDEQGTHEAMYETLLPGDLVFVDGGDGTVAQAINGHDNVPLLERKVAAYSGIGGTALASYGVDQLKQSPSRIVQTKLGRKAASVVVSLHQVAVSPKMTITDAVSGIQQKAKDITIVNGSRMAIYGKLHTRLDREDFEEITTSPWGHIGTLVSMLKLQNGSLYGKLLSADAFIVTSKDGSDVPIHFDGDRRFIPSGSEVSVGISRHAVRALAPMLSNTVDH
jgi:hypothetical protein